MLSHQKHILYNFHSTCKSSYLVEVYLTQKRRVSVFISHISKDMSPGGYVHITQFVAAHPKRTAASEVGKPKTSKVSRLFCGRPDCWEWGRNHFWSPCCLLFWPRPPPPASPRWRRRPGVAWRPRPRAWPVGMQTWCSPEARTWLGTWTCLGRATTAVSASAWGRWGWWHSGAEAATATCWWRLGRAANWRRGDCRRGRAAPGRRRRRTQGIAAAPPRPCKGAGRPPCDPGRSRSDAILHQLKQLNEILVENFASEECLEVLAYYCFVHFEKT